MTDQSVMAGAAWLDDRPAVVAIAGPNGGGKTTFYHAHVEPSGLRLVNADRLAEELDIDPYQAARIADSLRRELVRQRESFAFETVFSDPVGDKLRFLKETAARILLKRNGWENETHATCSNDVFGRRIGRGFGICRTGGDRRHR